MQFDSYAGHPQLTEMLIPAEVDEVDEDDEVLGRGGVEPVHWV